MNNQSVSYELMCDIIQDTIVYNIQNNHPIEVANFKWKFKNKLLDYFKHKNIIEIVSLDEIKEKQPQKYESL
jgi:hypothetical protein